MLEKLIFNVLAFTLFILIFFKLVKKNDTSYVYLLVFEFIGMVFNFIELSIGRTFGVLSKIIMYILSVAIPIIIIWLEYAKKIYFMEIYSLIIARIAILLKKENIAKKQLIILIEKYPQSYLGNKFLAQIFEKEEKYELALERYQQIYEKEQNEEIYLKIGKLYGCVGREEEAIRIFSDLLNKKPDYYNVSLLLAEVLYNKQDYKEAVQVYLNAIKHNPLNYELYYSLAMTYTMLNDFPKAKQCYEKAAKINSIEYNIKYNLGQINLLYGEIEESERYFLECINNEKTEVGSYYYLARISMIKGNLEQAKNYANIAIEEEPKIYYKILEDNIFIPLVEKLKKPEKENVSKKKNRKKYITKKQIQINKHLDETCKLAGKLSNDDIEMMSNVKKNKNEQIKSEKEINEKDM